MAIEAKSIPEQIEKARESLKVVKQEINKLVVGQENLINCMLIGVLSDGHLLLEGGPGIAKTLAANTLARTIHLDFKRVQFTPDLLPADLIGTPIYNPN